MEYFEEVSVDDIAALGLSLSFKEFGQGIIILTRVVDQFSKEDLTDLIEISLLT